MAAIKYERELLNYLQSCKKKPTPAGIWSAAIELKEDRMKYWYDFAAAPIMQVGEVCEKIEDCGGEIMGIFNTGAVTPISVVKVLKPGKQEMAPVIGIACRFPGRAPGAERVTISGLIAAQQPSAQNHG